VDEAVVREASERRVAEDDGASLDTVLTRIRVFRRHPAGGSDLKGLKV